MLRLVTPILLAGGLTLLGSVSGWLNDSVQLTAILMAFEPLWIVLGIWTAAIARWSGHSGISIGMTVGLIGGTLGAHLPYPALPLEISPPSWIAPLHRCATAIDMPEEPVRIVQWTLDNPAPADLSRVLLQAEPDVVVLHGALDDQTVAGLAGALSSEAKRFGDGPGSAVVLAKGGFHPCGTEDEWTSGGAYPYGVAFVGVPPNTVFPLVVASFPSVLGDWGARESAQQRAWDLLSGLQGASTVTVAETRSPRSARSLVLGFSRVGMNSLAIPANWPARIRTFPLLTLHPSTRVWTGPIWRVRRIARVAAPSGWFAPVLVELQGENAEERAPAQPRRPLNEPVLEEAP